MLSKQETEKAKVFIASQHRTESDRDTMGRIETALEQNPFVEWYYSPMKSPANMLPHGTEPWKVAMFEQEVENMQQANFVVAIADQDGLDTDSSTAFKLGLAYALNKPVILITEDTRPLSVLITESAYACLNTFDGLADYNFIKKPQIPYSGRVF